jgi:hypothetical protein
VNQLILEAGLLELVSTGTTLEPSSFRPRYIQLSGFLRRVYTCSFVSESQALIMGRYVLVEIRL